MERVTRKIFDYIAEMKRTVTRQRLHKDLKKEVETGKNGTQKYVIKQGINKGKTL
jgi:hypothetical protein|tara:strand:- start:386 stop:550 length:165 start_codon:yes stop_codon:yes gene_type:complete